MNVMRASMEITDEFYSNLNDGDVQKRISLLGNTILETDQENFVKLLADFFDWKKKQISRK